MHVAALSGMRRSTAFDVVFQGENSQAFYLPGVEALFDSRNLNFLTSGSDYVTHRFAHQGPRYRRHVRDRSCLRIGLILSHNAKLLHAPIVSAKRDRTSEGNCVIGRRGWHHLCGSNSFCKISDVAQRSCRLPAPFVNVVDRLHHLVGIARCLKLRLQGS